MLRETFFLPERFYTASAVEKTRNAFSALCVADFHDEILIISAQSRHVIYEFLNYVLCVSVQEQR